MQTMLDRIAEAEQQADAILEQASKDAKDSIAKAKTDAEAAVAEAAESEHKQTADALARAESEGERLSEQILCDVRKDIIQSHAAAAEHVPEAVTYLMERIEATV